MTTLITGAGMVGTLAAARLIRERQERPVLYDVAFGMANVSERVPLDQVTLVRGDINDLPDLVRAVQQHGVDTIIHTAGFLTWMIRERPYAGVRVNLNGTLSVLEAARLTGVKRVVFCSSSVVYMGMQEAPPGGKNREHFLMDPIANYPPSVYASMKLAGEWLCHCYRNEYGVDTVSVRFGGICGPWHGTPSGGPSMLAQMLIESAYYGRPCRLSTQEYHAPGMDYVHASDAAQGTVRAAFAANPANCVYNISMGKLYAVPELIEMIEGLSDKKIALDLYEGKSISGYQNENYPADLTTSQGEIGYQVEYPMETAIKDYLEWLSRQAPR